MHFTLDHSALNALFPEGSEARLNLRNHVIQCFINARLKDSNVTADVRKLVNDARKEAIDKCLVEFGVTRNNWGKAEVAGWAKDNIALAARSAVESELHKAVREEAQGAYQRVEGMLARLVEDAVNRQINKLVKEQLATKLSDALTQALKA